MLRRDRNEDVSSEAERERSDEEVELLIQSSRPSRRKTRPSSPSMAKQHREQSQYGKIESQQYEQEESEVWWHHQLQRHFQDRNRYWTFSRTTDCLRWSLTLVTGLVCGALALTITTATHTITAKKFATFHYLVGLEMEGKVAMGVSFAFLFVSNLVYAFLAWYFVFMEPMAAGSGIPEVKVYLNGLHIPHLLSLKTLVCKALGLVFAVSASLPLGKEG
eukprot:gene24382-29477_t